MRVPWIKNVPTSYTNRKKATNKLKVFEANYLNQKMFGVTGRFSHLLLKMTENVDLRLLKLAPKRYSLKICTKIRTKEFAPKFAPFLLHDDVPSNEITNLVKLTHAWILLQKITCKKRLHYCGPNKPYIFVRKILEAASHRCSNAIHN